MKSPGEWVQVEMSRDSSMTPGALQHVEVAEEQIQSLREWLIYNLRFQGCSSCFSKMYHPMPPDLLRFLFSLPVGTL